MAELLNQTDLLIFWSLLDWHQNNKQEVQTASNGKQKDYVDSKFLCLPFFYSIGCGHMRDSIGGSNIKMFTSDYASLTQIRLV